MTDWKSTIEEHGPQVWNSVYRIVGNEADASDCFQEVFVTAVLASRKQHIRNMRAFLSVIATQRSIDLLRKRKPCFRLHTLDRDGDAMQSADPPPIIGMQAKERSEQVRAALAKIPPQEAQVFCLRILNELSYRQIAEEMKINENYVGVLIARAREKLQQHLKSSAVEYGNRGCHE